MGEPNLSSCEIRYPEFISGCMLPKSLGVEINGLSDRNDFPVKRKNRSC